MPTLEDVAVGGNTGGELKIPAEATPATPGVASVFAGLRAFWSEIEAARTSALAGALPRLPTARRSPLAVALDPVADQALSHLATTIHARLLSVLVGLVNDANRIGHGAARETWREAQFVMAALADDIFVRLDWSGANWWLWNPLETAIFGTRVAGRRVFSRIEEITTGADPADRELAIVYLAALCLGFEGEYAGTGNPAALDEYRRRLRRFIIGDREVLQGPVVTQCYAHTDISGRRSLLPSARGWWWAAAAVVAVWLVASSLLWLRLTGPIATAAAGSSAPPASQIAAPPVVTGTTR